MVHTVKHIMLLSDQDLGSKFFGNMIVSLLLVLLIIYAFCPQICGTCVTSSY